MDQDEIVIVDRKGVEHVFPAGMDPKKAAEIVRRRTMTMGESVIEGLGGAKDEIVDQAKGLAGLAKGMGRAIMDSPSNLMPGNMAATLGREAGMASAADGSIPDPTGIRDLVKRDESTPKKIGRGAVLAAETVLPFLRPVSRVRGMLAGGKTAPMAEAGQVGKASAAAETLGAATKATKNVPKAAIPEPMTTTETIPLAKGPLTTPPAGPRFTMARPVSVKPEAAVTGTGTTPISVPTFREPVGFSATDPVGRGATGNAAAKAEAAAEAARAGRTKPPGREPYAGPERRGEGRIASEAEDKAYKTMRERIEAKSAMERAKAALIRPAEKKAPAATSEKKSPVAEPVSEPIKTPDPEPVPEPVKAETPAPESATTFAAPATEAAAAPAKGSLEDMLARYGREGAAAKAGMTPQAFDAWIKAGPGRGRAERAAEIFKARFGSTRTNREFGTNFPSTGKLPPHAVEGIRAAAKKEMAAGKISDKTQALLDRIAAEEGEGGSTLYSGIDPKAIWRFAQRNPALSGGAAGAALGMQDEEDPLGGAIGGGVLGAAGGKLLSKYGLIPLWTDSLLSGGAIPKNVAASASTPTIALLENIGAPEKLAMNPIKRQMQVGKNMKTFWEAMKNPSISQANTDMADKVHLPAGRTIGAIDAQLRRQLVDSGLNKAEWERHMLMENNPFSAAVGNTGDINNALSRTIFRFTKVPVNLVRGGLQETAHMVGLPFAEPAMPHVNQNMRRALTAGATVAGGLAGDQFTQAKPGQERMTKAARMSIIMAMLGRRAVPFTMAATLPSMRKHGLPIGGAPVGSSFGSLTPVPEIGLHPQGLFQTPYSGAVKFWKKILGKKAD